MFKVKVCASSANLGSGFDVLGLALDMFNEFEFSKDDSFIFEGFDEWHSNVEKNLIASSYIKAFERIGKEAVPVKIRQVVNNIPRAGGLGSSASCIVAGVKAMAHFSGENLSDNELFNIACEIETHPDNVAPCYYGGLNACYKVNGKYYREGYDVSDKLFFMIAYPNFSVSTAKARKALPSVLEYGKIIENTSRIVNLPRAFESGNFELLKECVKDNLHEPYRIKLIDGAENFRAVANDNGVICLISGSGATLLFIAKNEQDFECVKKHAKANKWAYRSVKPYFLKEESL